MNAHDLIKEAIAEKGKFDSVYWIACGGSMIDLIPAHELLQHFRSGIHGRSSGSGYAGIGDAGRDDRRRSLYRSIGQRDPVHETAGKRKRRTSGADQ